MIENLINHPYRKVIFAGVALGFLLLSCLALLVTDYRLLVWEQKLEAATPMTQPSTREPEMPPLFSSLEERSRPVLACRYFTGRSLVTQTFSRSDGIDSCPLLYRPRSYGRL